MGWGRSALHAERSPCIDANVRCKRARRSASLHIPRAGLQCDVRACKVTCMRARGLCRLAYRRARLQSDLHACIRLCWLAVVFACVHLPRACMQTREQACRATCWLARALWTYAQSRAGLQSDGHACRKPVLVCSRTCMRARGLCRLADWRARSQFHVLAGTSVSLSDCS